MGPEQHGELVLEIESDRYAPDDPGWLEQVEALANELEQKGAAARRYTAPKPGEKGPVADLMLNLVASGGGEIAAAAILTWVASYRGRRVKIRRADGEGSPVTVQQATFDEATLRQLAAELQRLSGGQSTG